MFRERLLNRAALQRDSNMHSQSLAGKLDIKRHEPGILFISLPIGSLFKLAIMT